MAEPQMMPSEVTEGVARIDSVVAEVIHDFMATDDRTTGLVLMATAAGLSLAADKMRDVYGQPPLYPDRLGELMGLTPEEAVAMSQIMRQVMQTILESYDHDREK